MFDIWQMQIYPEIEGALCKIWIRNNRAVLLFHRNALFRPRQTYLWYVPNSCASWAVLILQMCIWCPRLNKSNKLSEQPRNYPFLPVDAEEIPHQSKPFNFNYLNQAKSTALLDCKTGYECNTHFCLYSRGYCLSCVQNQFRRTLTKIKSGLK